MMLQQTQQVQAYFNPQLRFAGTLITNYRRNESNRQGAEWLRAAGKYKPFHTAIRWTDKVDESTFAEAPIVKHSPRCNASKDYRRFTAELMRLAGDAPQGEDEKGGEQA